jgi:hypothetical protein
MPEMTLSLLLDLSSNAVGNGKWIYFAGGRTCSDPTEYRKEIQVFDMANPMEDTTTMDQLLCTEGQKLLCRKCYSFQLNENFYEMY